MQQFVLSEQLVRAACQSLALVLSASLNVDFGNIYDHRHHPEQMAPSCTSTEMSNLFTKDQSPETLHESSRKLERDQVFIGDQGEQLQKEPAQSRKLKTLKPVPDVDGQRWCRACGKMLPVSAFPAGKRRYLCASSSKSQCVCFEFKVLIECFVRILHTGMVTEAGDLLMCGCGGNGQHNRNVTKFS